MSTTIELNGLYINIASAGFGLIRATLCDYSSDRVLCSALEPTAAEACVALARDVLAIYLRIWKHIENEEEMPQRFHSTRKEGVWSVTASPWVIYPALRPDASKRLKVEAEGQFTPEQLEHIGTELLRFSTLDRAAQDANRSESDELAHRFVDKHFPIRDTVERQTINDQTGSVALGCIELDCDFGRELGKNTEQLNAFWDDVEAVYRKHFVKEA